MKFYNPNLGKHPADPDYDSNFNEEEAWDRYEEEAERRSEMRREEKYDW